MIELDESKYQKANLKIEGLQWGWGGQRIQIQSIPNQLGSITVE